MGGRSSRHTETRVVHVQDPALVRQLQDANKQLVEANKALALATEKKITDPQSYKAAKQNVRTAGLSIVEELARTTPKQPHTVAVLGNSGVGKSTILNEGYHLTPPLATGVIETTIGIVDVKSESKLQTPHPMRLFDVQGQHDDVEYLCDAEKMLKICSLDHIIIVYIDRIQSVTDLLAIAHKAQSDTKKILVIRNKCENLAPGEITQIENKEGEVLKSAFGGTKPAFFLVSARSGFGMEQLRNHLSSQMH